MKIVVLSGGLSPERDVSLSTGTQVCNALRRAGQQAILVDLFYGVEHLETPIEAAFAVEGELPPCPVPKTAPDITALRNARHNELGTIGPNVLSLCKAADIVFMAMHGEPGENGMLQAMFDMMEIRYTGTGYLGSAIAMDKYISKQLFARAGILTPDFRLYHPGDRVDYTQPCIVKPCSNGSSIGITKVFSEADMSAAAALAFSEENAILVEPFIVGREITCGVLGKCALPPAEVIPKGDFYDYAHKYQNGLITEICPALIPDELTEEVCSTSLKIMEVLGLSVYARMDYIYSTDGRLYCLEANTLPGLTPTSHLPAEAKAAGMPYEALCMEIVRVSLEKYGMELR